MQTDAERELREFEEHIRERDLAEKRKLAPGWLDSDARLLEPERSAAPGHKGAEAPTADITKAEQPNPDTDEGAALDRAFGGMGLK